MHEVDHSPPFSAEVKNEWGRNCAPPICLYVMERNNFACNIVTCLLTQEDNADASYLMWIVLQFCIYKFAYLMLFYVYLKED